MLVRLAHGNMQKAVEYTELDEVRPGLGATGEMAVEKCPWISLLKL